MKRIHKASFHTEGRVKALRRLLAAALAVCVLAAGAAASDGGAAGDAARTQRIERAFAEHSGMLGLTQEQRLEDYDYLWETLESSFPMMGVARRGGVDVAALRESGRETVEEFESDFALYSAVMSAVYGFGGAGHLALLDPMTYEAYRAMYAEIDQMNDEAFADHFAPWKAVIQGEDSTETYRRTMYAEKVFYAGTPADASPYAETPEGGEPPANIGAAILPGDIAYLKIDQMQNDYREDQKAVYQFYEKAEEKGCGDLIIDITCNGGGDTRYWEQVIAAPNIDRPLSWSVLLTFQDSENNRPYLEKTFDRMRPISELPKLQNADEEDVKRMTHFVESVNTVYPLKEGEKMFEGRIWVLTSPAVYSSSEAFAIFCKRTGFATLVGQTTGGDGMGVDPVYCVLPNSKYIIRYSMLAGLNSDGRNNEEYGTSPDITMRRDETALDACLRAIAGREKSWLEERAS